MSNPALVDQVKSRYAGVVRSGRGGPQRPEAFGYSPEELASIPADANMGLSCGNPTATANLRPGEVVVDLGCGGGLDVLLAAPKIGPAGKATGIDMMPEMVERARRNAAKAGVTNVEFHLATIDRLPLPDGSADCIISNCVINLAPDKPAVFREMFRVLKPGGRVALSDIALKMPLPAEVGQDIMAYVGCIAGAIEITDYEKQLREAGFAAVRVIDTGKDLNAYAQVESGPDCCSAPAPPSDAPVSCSGPATAFTSLPLAQPTESGLHDRLAQLLARYDVNDFAASVQVYAVKA